MRVVRGNNEQRRVNLQSDNLDMHSTLLFTNNFISILSLILHNSLLKKLSMLPFYRRGNRASEKNHLTINRHLESELLEGILLKRA